MLSEKLNKAKNDLRLLREARNSSATTLSQLRQSTLDTIDDSNNDRRKRDDQYHRNDNNEQDDEEHGG